MQTVSYEQLDGEDDLCVCDNDKIRALASLAAVGMTDSLDEHLYQ